jgi:hypothetical protein
MKTTAFLQQLQDSVQQLQDTVSAEFGSLDERVLNFKPSSESWSILECLEHLNRYSRFYNIHISNALRNSAAVAEQEIGFSWLGRKSYEMVRPENTGKHKTMKHMNPNHSQLGRPVMEEFLEHQAELLQLLAKAASVDLNKKAVPIEFFRLLKLRTGEALLFVVAHEQRHVQQALRVKKQANERATAGPLLMV